MSNNKQSSVEWFAQKLYETLEIRGEGYVIDSLLDLAKAMHKEETLKLYNEYEDYLEESIKHQCGGQAVILSFGAFYDQTYGGGKNDKQ